VNSIPAGDRSVIDAEHLRLLSIFHFICAGLAFCGVAFASFYLVIFQTIFTNPRMWEQAQSGPPPAEVFGIFRFVLGMFVLWFLASAICNLLSAIYLRARRHQTFSMVVAGINCVHIPIGTALGIFTFIGLGRESVRKLYEAGPVA